MPGVRSRPRLWPLGRTQPWSRANDKVSMGVTKFGIFMVLAGISACTEHNPSVCEGDSDCTDPARPFCDLDGEYAESNSSQRHVVRNPIVSASVTSDTLVVH